MNRTESIQRVRQLIAFAVDEDMTDEVILESEDVEALQTLIEPTPTEIEIRFRDVDAEAEFWNEFERLGRLKQNDMLTWNEARAELGKIINEALDPTHDGVRFEGTHDKREDDDEDENLDEGDIDELVETGAPVTVTGPPHEDGD